MAIPQLAVDAPSVDGHYSWVPTPDLLTPGGSLQGGGGLGAAISAMEAATGRTVVWATAQYLTFAAGTDPIDIEVAVEVSGRNTTQARAVLSRDGREILTAHGALGHRSGAIDGTWVSAPSVPPPSECPRFRFFERGKGDMGDLVELLLVDGRQLVDIVPGERGTGSFSIWARCWKGAHLVTAADLAFVGDFMPVGFAQALGEGYAGTSLDNTIRVGQLVETEWILLTIHVQQIVNGFGHGNAELWAQDGTLLGLVSQTVVLRPYSRLNNPFAGSLIQQHSTSAGGPA